MLGRFGALRAPALTLALLTAAPGVAFAADGRGYEQVSPPDKNGNAVGVSYDGVTYHTSNPFLFGQDANSALFSYPGSAEGSQYGMRATFRAVRTDAGWVTRALAPGRFEGQPADPFGEIPQYYAATADTAKVAFSTDNLKPGFERVQRLDLLGVDGTDDPFSVGSAPIGPDLPTALFGDMTPDGSHIVFQSTAELEPSTTSLDDGTQTLYERLPATRETRVVSVLPDGRVAPFGAVLGSQPYSSEAAERPNSQARNAVSRDGSHIVFSAFSSANFDDPRDLYARIDGDHTVNISESQRTPAGTAATRPTLFQEANESGSVVYFLSNGQLTDDDDDAFTDLYRFAFNRADDGGTLTRISEDLGDSADLNNRVALVSASQDGEVVYFLSYVALGGDGTTGSPNLYVYDHGDLSFVATVAPDDSLAAQSPYNFYNTDTARIPQVRVTPDGETLVLQSAANLTAFDAGGRSEIYRYELGSAAPTCISCGIVGGAARGDASLVDSTRAPSNSLPNNLSDDGSAVVFQTQDALVAADDNGVQDVYEWRDGAVTLISGGHGSEPSIFLNASEDAEKHDIFFVTSDQLAWSDIDTAYDLYTARIGGGFPAPPAPPVECASDCQGPFAAVPFFAVPGTSTYDGPGNDEEPVPPPDPSFVVGKITAARAKRLAKSGSLTLPVRTNGKGKVTVKLSARFGRRWVASGSASRTLKRAGTVNVTVKLSRRARKRLVSTRKLPLRVDVRFANADVQRAQLTLKVAKKTRKR